MRNTIILLYHDIDSEEQPSEKEDVATRETVVRLEEFENFGKAILMLFGISPKTHEPARHLSRLINDPDIPEQIVDQIKYILPDLLMLGEEEHFMTDYGDESSYRLPSAALTLLKPGGFFLGCVCLPCGIFTP